MLEPEGQPMAALADLYASRNSSLSQFTKDVASCVFDACDQALNDAVNSTSRMIVVPAPTGGGKSSAATAYLVYLVRHTNLNAALLCDTQAQCDSAYRELQELLPAPGQVAVWTQSHDAEDWQRSDEKTMVEKGFRPAAKFTKDDLRQARIAIGTHAFFKGKNGHYISHERSLIVVDEKPNDVAMADISIGDIVQLHDGVVAGLGVKHPTTSALAALSKALWGLWEGNETDKALLFEGVAQAHPLMENHHLQHLVNIFDSGDTAMRELVSNTANLEAVQNALLFVKAASQGHAFMARYVQAQRQGARFIGYLYDFPVRPGMVLLDATADIDGVEQLVDWRETAPRMPKVNFENLRVQLVTPCELIRKKRVKEIRGNPQYVDAWKEWTVPFILGETTPGEEVLVVVHKDLKAHLPREGAEDWEGRNIHLCHWGSGIGSNRWKDCTAVFLLGEFHRPKRSTVAATLGLKDIQPTTKALRDAQQVRGLTGDYLTVQEGHLLRWTKQLACRGNVRNIDDEGNCGTMRLYMTGEFQRLLDNKDRLFPGCGISTSGTTPNLLRDAHTLYFDRLLRLLLETEQARIEAAQVDKLLNSRTRSHKKALTSPKGRSRLASVGWCYVPGRRGRGGSAAFAKIRSTPQVTIAA